MPRATACGFLVGAGAVPVVRVAIQCATWFTSGSVRRGFFAADLRPGFLERLRMIRVSHVAPADPSLARFQIDPLPTPRRATRDERPRDDDHPRPARAAER